MSVDLTVNNLTQIVRDVIERKRVAGCDVDASRWDYHGDQDDIHTKRTLMVKAAMTADAVIDTNAINSSIASKKIAASNNAGGFAGEEDSDEVVERYRGSMRGSKSYGNSLLSNAELAHIRDMASLDDVYRHSIVEAMDSQYGLLGTEPFEKVNVTVNAAGNYANTLIGVGSHYSVTDGSSNYAGQNGSGNGGDNTQNMIQHLTPLFGLPNGPIIRQPYDTFQRDEWMLPNAYEGPNLYNMKIIFNRMVEIPSTILDKLCPYEYRNDLTPIKMYTMHFHDGMLTKLPYETVPRMLTSHRSGSTSYFARYGIGAQIEATFLGTPEGRMIWSLQIDQIGVAAHRTIAAGALIALLSPHRVHRPTNELFNKPMPLIEFERRLATEAKQVGCLQKPGAYPLEHILEDCEEEFQRRQVSYGGRSEMFVLGRKGWSRLVRNRPEQRSSEGYWMTGRPMQPPAHGTKFSVADIPLQNIIEIEPLLVGIHTQSMPLLEKTITFGEYHVLQGNPVSAQTPKFCTSHCDSMVKSEPDDSMTENKYDACFNHTFMFTLRDNQAVDELTDLTAPATADPFGDTARGRYINEYGAVFFTPGFDYTRFKAGRQRRELPVASALGGTGLALNLIQPRTASTPTLRENSPLGPKPNLAAKLRLFEDWIAAWKSRRGVQEEREFLASVINGSTRGPRGIAFTAETSPVHMFATEVGTVGEFYEFFVGERNCTKLEQRNLSSGRNVPSIPQPVPGNAAAPAQQAQPQQQQPPPRYPCHTMHSATQCFKDQAPVYPRSSQAWTALLKGILRLPDPIVREFFRYMPTIESVNQLSRATNHTGQPYEFLLPTAEGVDKSQSPWVFNGRLMTQAVKADLLNELLMARRVDGLPATAASTASVALAGSGQPGESPVIAAASSSGSGAGGAGSAGAMAVTVLAAHTSQPISAVDILKMLLRAWPILNLDFFLLCQRHNVPIGMDINCLRPFMTWSGSSLVVVAHRDVGKTYISHPNCMLGWNTVIKQVVLSYTLHFVTHIVAGDAIIVKPGVILEKQKGGADLTRFRPDVATRTALEMNRFTESMFCIPLEPGEELQRAFLDITGNYDRNVVDDSTDKTPHYSTAGLFTSFWRLQNVRPPVSEQSRIMCLANRKNTICSRGVSWRAHPCEGGTYYAPSPLHEVKGTGPRAQISYAGAGAVWNSTGRTDYIAPDMSGVVRIAPVGMDLST